MKATIETYADGTLDNTVGSLHQYCYGGWVWLPELTLEANKKFEVEADREAGTVLLKDTEADKTYRISETTPERVFDNLSRFATGYEGRDADKYVKEVEMPSDDLYEKFDYKTETEALVKSLDKEQLHKVLSYEYCEIAEDFVGFLHSYKDLADNLPKDTTIIDIGGCYGIQGEYFKDFAEYILVEPNVPAEHTYNTPNTTVITATGQDFIKNALPVLQENGLDLNKTFCICSYVPDEKLRNELIPETFPYYRATYAGCKTHQRLPEGYEHTTEKADKPHRKENGYEHE